MKYAADLDGEIVRRPNAEGWRLERSTEIVQEQRNVSSCDDWKCKKDGHVALTAIEPL